MNKHQVNAYFATLIVAVAGSLATWVIVRVAYNTQPFIVKSGPNSEASYGTLQQSILHSSPAGVPQGQ